MGGKRIIHQPHHFFPTVQISLLKSLKFRVQLSSVLKGQS